MRTDAVVVCLALAVPCMPTGGQGGGASSLVVFGDSLSDTGNFSDLFGGTFPPPPYFDGRFSNGPLWVERLADRLGATISDNRAVALDTSTDLVNTRLPAFLNETPAADPGALHVILIGGNDYLGETERAAVDTAFRQQLADTLAANVSTTITSLAGIGAERFLLLNLSDIGATPQADEDAAQAGNPNLPQGVREATILANEGLADAAGVLRASLGVEILEFDTFAFFDEVAGDPASFGLTNIEDNVLRADLSLIGDPEEFLFWDPVHPTARGHELLGEAVYEFIVPTPTAWTVVVALPLAPRARRGTRRG